MRALAGPLRTTSSLQPLARFIFCLSPDVCKEFDYFPFSHQRSGYVAPLCRLQCGLSVGRSGLANEQGPQPSKTQGPRTVSHNTESGYSDLFHIPYTEVCFLSRFSLVFAVERVE